MTHFWHLIRHSSHLWSREDKVCLVGLELLSLTANRWGGSWASMLWRLVFLLLFFFWG
ncbi:hypothetical protein BDV34DRAFT_202079 [Aspergillus parasiticus]|uniref:Uncharacterized protein n=1 Tax=Aspergillus parasiticus TaxID=5067 RepID=A0A5N6D9F3_ASPPA|nr:hypothetical protein BDV34DRAFT_202079 [Aspergillus parasiticus]